MADPTPNEVAPDDTIPRPFFGGVLARFQKFSVQELLLIAKAGQEGGSGIGKPVSDKASMLLELMLDDEISSFDNSKEIKTPVPADDDTPTAPVVDGNSIIIPCGAAPATDSTQVQIAPDGSLNVTVNQDGNVATAVIPAEHVADLQDHIDNVVAAQDLTPADVTPADPAAATAAPATTDATTTPVDQTTTDSSVPAAPAADPTATPVDPSAPPAPAPADPATPPAQS